MEAKGGEDRPYLKRYGAGRRSAAMRQMIAGGREPSR
jgi:hypothetical protein